MGSREQLDKPGGSGFLEEWKSLVFSSFIFYFIIPPKLGHESPGPQAAVGGVYGFWWGWGSPSETRRTLGGVVRGTQGCAGRSEEETGTD